MRSIKNYPFFILMIAVLCCWTSGAVPTSKPTAEMLRQNGDAKAKTGNYYGALQDFRAAIKAEPYAVDPTLYYRIAVAASKTKSPNLGLAALRKFRKLKPEFAEDKDVKQVYADLTFGDPEIAATIRAVNRLLKQANEESDPATKKHLCREARAKLRPYLSNPWQENLELWRLGGVLAVESGDRDLAAVCLGAINDLLPDQRNDPQMQAVVDLLSEPASAGIKSVRQEREYRKLQLWFEMDDQPWAELDGKLTEEMWLAPQYGSTPKLASDIARLLLANPAVMPDPERAKPFVENLYAAWRSNGRRPPGDPDAADESGNFSCLIINEIRGLDEDEVNRFRIERWCEQQADLDEVFFANTPAARPAVTQRYQAYTVIGVTFLTGKGWWVGTDDKIAIDYDSAEYWLLKAANLETGSAPIKAWYNLGQLYSPDVAQPTPKADAVKALDYFARAGRVKSDDPELTWIYGAALYSEGIAYCNGRPGVDRNRFLAAALFKKATAAGNDDARAMLGSNEFTQFLKWDRW